MLDNAYKHSGENSPIYLQAYIKNNNIIFEVTDEGEGIDLNIMDAIFEGFTTKTKSTADSGSGVGLGLSICKAIVTAHDGTISAQNRNLGGAAFKVVLPVDGGVNEL